MNTAVTITDTARGRWNATVADHGTAGRVARADPVAAVSVKARGKVRVHLRRRLPVDSLESG
jgi:hypothetical protein